jgi:hypothetical protein
MGTIMKRRRHTPEQVVRKIREGERLLNEGQDLGEVLRHLEVTEATFNGWRARRQDRDGRWCGSVTAAAVERGRACHGSA